jgi:hypothetical protein
MTQEQAEQKAKGGDRDDILVKISCECGHQFTCGGQARAVAVECPQCRMAFRPQSHPAQIAKAIVRNHRFITDSSESLEAKITTALLDCQKDAVKEVCEVLEPVVNNLMNDLFPAEGQVHTLAALLNKLKEG